MPKYYLISYYARLPKGGFGFSRTYYSVPLGQEFDIELFDIQIANESNLKPNDIALISRVPITVEEYNWNTDKESRKIYKKQEGKIFKMVDYDCPGLNKLKHMNGPHGDEDV